jgi:uncharacterized protein with HEPN domain
MHNSELLQKDWHLYVADMIGFATKVLTYTDGLNQEKFIANKLNYDATMRNLSMLSEAAMDIPKHIRTIASPINWQQIIGLHDQLIHSYWTIDNCVVWDIIQNEIPVLMEQLEALKKAADENQVR